MNERQQRLQARLLPEIAEFRASQQTLQLATLTAQGQPSVSYSPFIYQPDGYYILISDLAQHGENLKHNKQVCAMLIQDESEAKSPYARKRLSFDSEAVLVDRESEKYQLVIQALYDRFGDIIHNLSSLGDFHLYQLVPNQGRYVKGFGQAFDLSGHEMLDIVHVTKGHLNTWQSPQQD